MRKTDGSALLNWVITLVVIGLLAGGGYWYWKHLPEEAPNYRTAPIARGDVVQAVTATGQLNPVLNVQVGSQVSGIINKLTVDFNAMVTNGQLIAQLDPSTFKAARDQAKGDLENSKAALELAQVETRRAEALYAARLISQSDYDKAQADLHQAQAMVMIKTAALDKTQVDLDRTTIYAPIDGVVISRNVDVGQTVAASLSAPTLFVIANDLSKMQIDAAVSEADVGGIKTNQAVIFTVDAFPTRSFEGTVVQVRNAALTNQNVVTYDTVIGVDNPGMDLKPGMTANVSIITSEKDDVLRVPNAALRFRPPELVAAAATNAAGFAGGAAGQRGGRGGGGGGGGRGLGGGDGGGRGLAGGGTGGPTGAPGGGARRRGERSLMRTVYVPVPDNPATPKKEAWKAVQIRVGITDGLYTEVMPGAEGVEGLKEGDAVIVGQNNAAPATTAPPTTNPFGGGRRGF